MDSVQIEKSAAAWLARRDRGDWGDADQAQLDAWLRASTAHRVAFIRLDAAWKQALRLNTFAAGMSADGSAADQRPSQYFGRSQILLTPGQAGSAAPGRQSAAAQSMPRSPSRWPAALAACLLVAVAVLVWRVTLPRDSYSTSIGGLASVPMQDGSKVTLNTNTEIRVAMTETERRVELGQGEAFFQVAKDAARPFVVSAGDQRIIAVGTQFSVRRDGNDVRVIVTEGRVRVERGGGTRSLPAAELNAGSVARTDGAGVLVQHKPVAEAEEYLSWRNGFLVFRDTSLAQAVSEFNRYSIRQIVIDDESLAGIRIGGSFRSDNVDAFLRLLREGFDVDIEAQGDRLVLKHQ